LGDREVVIAREMTKRHQDVVRGPAHLLAKRYRQDPPRGEICVVIEGRSEDPRPSKEELEGIVLKHLHAGETPRAIAEALRSTTLRRREIYQLALRLARDLL
ncbi:MAG: 16S rRNA (cytidine(1402)-2'-O)-methyltransferase, partial [Deltaproteobacteria bacterium]|nr:16S rRNA (cytidine(1402)-2'-O)-methyltransferase [Deltaproteobacteria bacterium]